MKNERFFCKDCFRYFYQPNIYEEKHGLDSPPYERVAICSKCGGSNFVKVNTLIEKCDVAEKILPVIMMLNKFLISVKDVFGFDLKNDNINSSIEVLSETISEMFDFLDTDMQNKVLFVCDESHINMILKYIKGEL